MRSEGEGAACPPADPLRDRALVEPATQTGRSEDPGPLPGGVQLSPLSSFRTLLSPPKETLPVRQSLPISPSPSPGQPQSAFCLCGFNYFGRFHINGIIEHVAFVPGSFHLVKCSQAPRVAHHVIPLRPNTLPSWERPISFPIH